MDRTTSIATFVAQSTRGDSACAVPQHTARQTSIRGLPDSAPLPTSSHRTGKSARFLGPLPRARTHVGRTKDATDRKPRVHRSGGSYVVELYRGASSQRDRQQSPGRADRAVSGTRRSTKSGLGSRLMRRSPAGRAIDLDWMHVMTTGGGFGRRAMVDADVIAEALARYACYYRVFVTAQVVDLVQNRRREFARDVGSPVRASMMAQPCFLAVDRNERLSAKSMAPSIERNPPEIFWRNFIMRPSRSA